MKLSVDTWVLGIIAFLQLAVFGYQAFELKKTVDATADQSKDMERSIVAATRMAAATEEVAKYMEISSKTARDSVDMLRERTAQQTRAYISVVSGIAVYQERDKKIRFEARPQIVNDGFTPAYGVSFTERAGILPTPLPADYVLPASKSLSSSGAILGSKQSASMDAIVDDYCKDNEVDPIKHANGKALYVWGVIAYKDVFDAPHETKFCQLIVWLPNGNAFFYSIAGRNQAN